MEPYEGEDVVDATLNFPAHEWDFDNDMVNAYRSRAARINHFEMLPDAKMYCFPEYFSEGPLRDMPNGCFLARTRIPKQFAEHRQFVTIQIEALVTTAKDVIESLMKRLDEPYKSSADPESFILKVAGCEEYIYGDTKVIEYEAVRNAVRNENDVEFVLVQRADRTEVIEQERQKQIKYGESLVNAYDVSVRDASYVQEDMIISPLDEHIQASRKDKSTEDSKEYEYESKSKDKDKDKDKTEKTFVLENQMKYLHETEWHFRVKIVQLMNALKCPRFDEKLMRSLKVVVELWHGNNLFSNCVLSSTSLPCDNHIPYGQWLGVKQIQYSQIPRETVVCIQVLGVMADGKTDECLAWCRVPLIDHRHKLRRGKYLLTLWEIPAFERNKHGPKNDPYALRPYRYRGTNRDRCTRYIPEERSTSRTWNEGGVSEEMTTETTIDSNTMNTVSSIDTNQSDENGSTNDTNGTVVDSRASITNNATSPTINPVEKSSITANSTSRNTRSMKRRRECQLLIEFDEFAFEVIAPKYLARERVTYDPNTVGGVKQLKRSELRTEQKVKLETILSKNPLEELLPEEKALVWSCRNFLFTESNALPAFLRAVDWTDIKCVTECHKYLDIWAPPKKPWDAIEFLDYRYADTYLREKAIHWISDMHDSDLSKYLLQLIQCLKYENHHNSRLQEFLLERGLRNPYQIGHFLFWALKAEFHELQHCERFGLIMEEYLKHAGEHARQLFMQNMLLKRFEVIADKVYRVYKIQKWSKEKCKEVLKRELHKLNKELPVKGIQIPLNPRWHATKLLVDKCRFMDSAKVPLWLELQNSDEFGKPITVMFKSGDDLRQDMLTIQILEIMDQMWLQNKIDLHLKPYRVLATGVNSNMEGVGMLELVLPSITVKEINKVYGTFAKESIDMYMAKNNPGADDLHKARENFARSCAGYCVATSVLGIGDRHPSNVLITDKGHFFHIDFGHFLGNFKKKMGMEREKVPLLFTPAMKYCIDQGEKYDDFLVWVADAFNILRQESRLLLVLFALMVPAGMPELMHEKDIDYFKNMLSLHADKDGATEGIHALVTAGRKDMRRLFDHWFHQQVH
ncbi:phosphatidylinositol-4,5-diphosphate 3-kinase [Reticulomyxa filosa]|uniref:Phosphatidylinositol-4,5-diphosphate 3-kinase n=1 Tax=Reticulomyxa filosa TaxID=46433 RepID=X6MVB9_RETFI|nr:phosphatidylinositol-4,5-diphosphate 3-kinase [Reticulomyxa filosa]|eukprot:ETO17799.1 phosphatidylinositol-4,5-diphosphate 3-kinase [Reticulomyxa filosa]